MFRLIKTIFVLALWAFIFFAYQFFAPDRVTFVGTGPSKAQYDELAKHGTEVYFGSGNKVDAWFFKSPHSNKVLIYSHGLGRNVGMNADRAAALSKDVSVFAYDYRGTGRSAGTMSEPSMIDDACAAYDLLVDKYHYKPEQIIGYGESLGTAVTAQLTTRRQLAGVIMVASFPCWKEAAFETAPVLIHLYPKSCWPVFDSAQALKKFKGPTLIIHGGKDELLSVSLGKRLFQASAGSPKQFVLLPGSQHDYVIEQPEADRNLLEESVRNFVDRT